MPTNSQLVFEFSTFRLNADSLVLYHENEIIRGVEKHSLRFFRLSLAFANQIATYDEIVSCLARRRVRG